MAESVTFDNVGRGSNWTRPLINRRVTGEIITHINVYTKQLRSTLKTKTRLITLCKTTNVQISFLDIYFGVFTVVIKT